MGSLVLEGGYMKANRLPKSERYAAALYLRLSKDDDEGLESSSITTQRKMLRAYAKENNYNIYDEYVDDGVSGTTFERPAFKRMIQDIENGYINMVITKDLSRLGRDYITAGQYTEIYFPSKKVRYIAINDGYDSDSPYTDIAPFKNVLNEMYARDTSKKIRSAFVTRMKEGAFVGPRAPYGYMRDPNNKHHLVADEMVAPVVQEMFRRAADGVLPIDIARNLNNKGVQSPSVYRCSNDSTLNVEDFTKRKEWSSAGITKMLRNPVYLGHMTQGKTTKVSFKSKNVIVNPEEDWFMVKNTHKPLVDEETFEMAARRSKQRTCQKKGTFHNIFTGIAKCGDCGRNMSTVGTRKKGAQANLACGGYKLYGSTECSNHFIDYDTLYSIVMATIKEIVCLQSEEKEDVFNKVKQKFERNNYTESNEKQIKELKKRSRQLDLLIEKLYEDHMQGIITQERLHKLLNKYEEQSRHIEEMLMKFQSRDKDAKKNRMSEKLEQLWGQYENVTELTPEILYRLIDRIEIGQGYFEKVDQARVKHQTVNIYFRFSGMPISKTYQV